MKKSILYIFIALLLFFLCCSKEKWKGKVYKEHGVNVIENQGSGLWGDKINDKIVLKENLALGNNEGPDYLVFHSDLSVSIDKELNIYILDIKNYRILKFDKLGNFIWKSGRKGQGPGEFQNPSKITISTFKEICVLDSFTLVHFFDSKGRYIRTNNLKGMFRDIQFTQDGRLFLNRVVKEQLGVAADFCTGEGIFLKKFPDEYLYGPKLSIGGRGHLGGGLWILENKIYMDLPDKYEIRVYDLNGILLEKIKRNIRLEPPKIEVTRSGFSIGAKYRMGPCFIYNGGILINQFLFIEEGNERDFKINIFLDFFNEKRQFLGSYKLSELSSLKTIDSEDNLYLVQQDPFPKIIRSKIAFN